MDISKMIKERIEFYEPQGGLGQTAKVFLALYRVSQPKTLRHVKGVALLAESVAIRLNYDSKAAFFGGLLHDVGKIIMAGHLFDGHDITAEEYAEVKKHALAGFEALKELHLFTALCAGLHHNLYKAGYGLVKEDFPSDWNMATIKKVLDVSMVISICDFIDAYTNRKTVIKDGSNLQGASLSDLLKNKYPDDVHIVNIALEEMELLYKE